mgnify:CR=1 FL=1
MFEHLINEDLEAVGAVTGADMGGISIAAGLAFLMFNLFTPPCFAAIGAIRREMNSARWTWFALGYQTLLAYCTSATVYSVGSLLTGVFTLPVIIGAALSLAAIVLVVCILARTGADLKDEGRLQLFGCLGDALDDLHVVYVESADCVTALICFLKHFRYHW